MKSVRALLILHFGLLLIFRLHFILDDIFKDEAAAKQFSDSLLKLYKCNELEAKKNSSKQAIKDNLIKTLQGLFNYNVLYLYSQLIDLLLCSKFSTLCRPASVC
jgi:hypothetical protein